MLNNTQFLDLMKSYMNPESYMSSIKNIPSVDLSSITSTMQKAMNILGFILLIIHELTFINPIF